MLLGVATGEGASFERLRQRQLAAASAVAAAAAVSIFAACFIADYVWIRQLRGGLRLGLFQLWFSFTPWVLGAVAYTWIYYRFATPAPPAPLILWLRRFHQLGPGRTPFHHILRRAAVGHGVPLTIRDTQFSSSLIAGSLRLVVALPLLAISLQFLFFVLWMLGVYVARDIPGTIVVGFVGAIVGTALTGFLIYQLVRSRGVVTLPSDGSTEAAGRFFDRLAEQPHKYFGGVLVLRTTDDDWQQVVTAAIERASAVIVDITDVSTNVLWEIRATLERKPAKALILARGVSVMADEFGIAPQRGADDADARSAAALASWAGELGSLAAKLAGSPSFSYPLYTRRGSARVFGRIVSRLSSRLSDAVASSLAVGSENVRYERRPLIALAAVSVIVLIGSLIMWRMGPAPLTEAERRVLTAAATGAPSAWLDDQSDAFTKAPNGSLATTFRYVIGLHRDSRHAEAVIALLSSHGDAGNPWLLLARGRAFLLSGECDCTSPLIASLSAAEVRINGRAAPEYQMTSLLDGAGTTTSARRRIVFLDVRADAPIGRVERVAQLLSAANFVVAFAPENVETLHALCGAASTPAVLLER